jgi:flagellar motor switch protein FliM
MSTALDQDAIDSIFAEAKGEKKQEAALGAGPATAPYNFTRAGQISAQEMKTITSVSDFFAMNLKHTIGGWLRTQFNVKLVSREQLSYQEFLDRLPDPNYICSIRLEPLGSLGLIEFDLALVAPIVDLLMGGVGDSAKVRDLTDIEEEILASVIQLIIRELNTAWLSIGLRFEFDHRESAGSGARMMSLAEKTLCVSFEVTMAEERGALNLCIPSVVLNQILRRLHKERDRPRRQSHENQTRLRNLIGKTTVGTVLQFTPMKLQARQLIELEPGKILRFPLSRYATSELCVGGLPIAKAHPVRSQEHRGAQIESIINEKLTAKASAHHN